MQSFGNESQIIEEYKGYLDENLKKTKKMNLNTALFFGLAEGLFIVVLGVLFYAGGFIIEDNPTDDGNDWKYDASEIFIAIFACVFAGVQAGTSEFFGPDTNAADEASKRVFEIIDYVNLRSPIVNANSASESQKLSAKDIKGKIEFRNVWFRNPNYREHFVLKGMSFVIEPNQSVAFVGQYGAGKSTIA